MEDEKIIALYWQYNGGQFITQIPIRAQLLKIAESVQEGG